MRIARPAILWRFLQLELWRLLALTAFIIVIVIAFAFTVKPLADGRLSPLDAIRFMGYAFVPMLQYALPFAAGFASTLSYHRMSQDNELAACYAGGISHRSMLVPASVIGLILGGVVLGLSDQAMPRLWRNMQELISNDVTRMVASNIERGQSFVLPEGTGILYADRLIPRTPDPASGAFKHFDLMGVVIAQRGEGGRLVGHAAARMASVWVYRNAESTDAMGNATPGQMRLVMRFTDSSVGKVGKASGQAGESTMEFSVPSNFRDDPKFMTFAEMLAAQSDPRLRADVGEMHHTLASLLSERTITDRIRETLRRDGRITLRNLSDQTVVLKGASLADAPEAQGFPVINRNGGGIEVTTVFEGGRTRNQRAKFAWIAIPLSTEPGSNVIVIRMSEVATTGSSSAAPDEEPVLSPDETAVAGTSKQYTISNLRLDNDRPTQVTTPNGTQFIDPVAQLLRLSSTDLLAKADARLAQQPTDKILAGTIARMRAEIAASYNEILSKFHERIASSIACCVMVILGAVMGMRLGSSVPLAVYLWSFLPALAAVLTISGGQRFTASWGAVGLVALYAGVLGLALLTHAQYRRLAMH